MIYLEMSRDEQHGGGTWGFTNCVWAPTRNRVGRPWAYWENVVKVREGDTIIHLRGKSQKACFIGYSTASGDGFATTQRPPDPGEWGFASQFYRADLTGYTPFYRPISVIALLRERAGLLAPFLGPSKRGESTKRHLFFDKRGGQLHCHQGAYLSRIDDALLTALFGEESGSIKSGLPRTIISVETASQISQIRTRLGQSRFADEIRLLYSSRCCFPDCEITDPRFLVAAHIARWCDNEALRGKLGNGLCFCLLHDKAFEVGLFTLDEHFAIFVNPREDKTQSAIVRDLQSHQGKMIRLSRIKPLAEALVEHWIRVDIDPLAKGSNSVEATPQAPLLN